MGEYVTDSWTALGWYAAQANVVSKVGEDGSGDDGLAPFTAVDSTLVDCPFRTRPTSDTSILLS